MGMGGGQKEIWKIERGEGERERGRERERGGGGEEKRKNKKSGTEMKTERGRN